MAITTSGTTLTFNDATTQTTAPVNTNANVNSVSAGTAISVSATTGAVTVNNTGVTSVAAGTGISVSASTGGVTITNSAPAVKAGEVKAWGNFNGTSSPATRATYNMSSFTRISAGKYSVSFTSALADANYAVNISTSPDQDGSVSANYTAISLFTNNYSTLTAPTTSGFSFCLNWSGAGVLAPTYICISVCGN
jgi:hypothetical protein